MEPASCSTVVQMREGEMEWDSIIQRLCPCECEQNKPSSDECKVRHKRVSGQHHNAHPLPKWDVRRQIRKPSGGRWTKSSGQYQKEKG